METHTQKILKISWGDKDSVKSRAKRGKATSAPDKKTLDLQKKYIKIAIHGKNKFRTLVLGATPELRDLALSMGSETIAVDISPRLTLALTNVMKYKDDDNNKFMIGDWLELHKFLEKDSFDIVLGDLVINNLPYELWGDFLKSLSYVMKKDGYFIPRHPIFKYPRKFRTFEKVIKEFRENNNSVFEMLLDLGLSTDTVKEGYDYKIRGMNWMPLKKYDKQLKKSLTKEEYSFFSNMMKHAEGMRTIMVSEKEFLKKISKYFKPICKKAVGVMGDTYRMPIYVLKNKKNRFSNIFWRFRR